MKIHIPPFSTAALLDELRGAGVHVRLEGGEPRAKFTETCPATPGIVQELRGRRAEIIEILTGHVSGIPETSPEQRHVSQICETSPEQPAFGSKLAAAAERIDREHRAEAARAEARRLVQVLRSAGHVVALVEPDGIRISPRPDDAMAAVLRSSKEALLQVLRAQAPKP